MYAIVDIAGKQFKVTKGQTLCVPRMDAKPETELELPHILLTESEGKITLGKPYISNAKVSAKVIEHKKDKKVRVFHKKRRKGYRKTTGHREQYTEILVQDIS